MVRLCEKSGPVWNLFIGQVRGGIAVVPDGLFFTNRIHRDDAAAAMVRLTCMEAMPAAVYVGVDNSPAELGDVLRFLAAEMGYPEPPVGPAGEARGGNKRCSNALLRSTGFQFAYPTFREGYREVFAGTGVRHP